MSEETVREAIRITSAGSHLALEPELSGDIIRAVKRTVAEVASPVILTRAISDVTCVVCSNPNSRKSPCSPIRNYCRRRIADARPHQCLKAGGWRLEGWRLEAGASSLPPEALGCGRSPR